MSVHIFLLTQNRLTDEQLEKAKYSFGAEGHRENILWYLYNREMSAIDVDEAFGYYYNATNYIIRYKREYFKKIGKVGHRFIYTASEQGREIVERIIRGN